ncbi:MAG: Nramp family divalent metal transporter [Planctomycetia bacterium]|nr:Nramp family divalent metal transporter [Planctomycetia bacterium]
MPEVLPDRDHGRLPDWQTGVLPEPLPLSGRNILRTIGPGAILLAGSIGGGEWIVGPLMAVRYGTEILWIATLAIFLQMIFNLEAIRYTLASGEPILTGILRLNPGPKFWAPVFVLAGIAQLATPGLALGCANVLFAAAAGREAIAGDAGSLMGISYAVLAVAVVMLLSGKSVERTLERLSWAMVVFIFTFLLVANVLFVPLDVWSRTATGFLLPRQIPANMDILLLGVFAATAGSGGLGNLVVSNWVRDKGWGMAASVGSIGGAFSGEKTALAPVGSVFPPTTENLRKWKVWWKYCLLDQTALWAGGCVVGMFLNVNLALAIVPENTQISGYSVGAFQARYMAEQLWVGFWALCLLNGFWILFSTQLANMDCLARAVTDIGWASWPGMRRWPASRLYAGLLLLFTSWGVASLTLGESALGLFKVLGVVACPVLAIGAFLILRVNTRFLPTAIRPPLWRRIALFLCGVVYSALALASLVSLFESTQ